MTPKELVTALAAMGWTQAQIAERVDVAQSTVSKIAGSAKDVRSKTYVALLALYHEAMTAKRSKAA